MKIGVLAINFGEPDEPTPEKVQAFLERIFLRNASLEGHRGEEATQRARELAEARTPGLVEDYRAIGGSPLDAQARAQAERLEAVLLDRGWDARVFVAFQFTDPSIDHAVGQAHDAGVETLVALPVYPICGPSTTIASLQDVARALEARRWSPTFVGLSGWHAEPGYEALRTAHIRRYCEEQGLDLSDPDTLLYFSVHGTPVKYLDEGSRYDRYVEEHCRNIASALGPVRYAVGFQNHTNRKLAWTKPDNEDRIEGLAEHHLVVDAVSFLHEQSETLAELDVDLREFIEGLGKEMHRVPLPHDHPRLAVLLADLVARALATRGGESVGLSPCRCGAPAGSYCTNAHRTLPPSPYAPPSAAR